MISSASVAIAENPKKVMNISALVTPISATFPTFSANEATTVPESNVCNPPYRKRAISATFIAVTAIWNLFDSSVPLTLRPMSRPRMTSPGSQYGTECGMPKRG